MVFARVTRRFEPAPDNVVALAKDFVFSTAPALGVRLELPGVGRPLEVVGVTLRPRSVDLGPIPPDVDVFLEYEPGADEGPARAAGWQAVTP
jgi:hypothetical protein